MSHTTPDVDTALEQAWTNLYAKLDMLTQVNAQANAQAHAEAQALAIIKTLGQELRMAAGLLQSIAETIKMRPNMTVSERLKLANVAIVGARCAREAAESVLG